jgi:hypothetical protein
MTLLKTHHKNVSQMKEEIKNIFSNRRTVDCVHKHCVKWKSYVLNVRKEHNSNTHACINFRRGEL